MDSEMTLRQFGSVTDLLTKLRADLRASFPRYDSSHLSNAITFSLPTVSSVRVYKRSISKLILPIWSKLMVWYHRSVIIVINSIIIHHHKTDSRQKGVRCPGRNKAGVIIYFTNQMSGWLFQFTMLTLKKKQIFLNKDALSTTYNIAMTYFLNHKLLTLK